MQPHNTSQSPQAKAAPAWMESPRENILGYVDMFPSAAAAQQSPPPFLEPFDQHKRDPTGFSVAEQDDQPMFPNHRSMWEASHQASSFLMNAGYESEDAAFAKAPLPKDTAAELELTQWKECAHQAIEQLEKAKKDALEWELLARETETKLKDCEKERYRVIDDMSVLVSDYEMLATKVGQTPEQVLKEEQGENARLHRFIHHMQSELKITTKRLYHARYEVSRLEIENRYLRGQLENGYKNTHDTNSNYGGLLAPIHTADFPEIQSV